MRRLLIATRNPGKMREIARILAGLPLKLVSLDDLGIEAEAEEPAATFRGNAVAKSLFYSRLAGTLTAAEDSGLRVDALGGRPGVLSARYGGPGLDDAGRLALVLRELREVEESRRGAHFVCWIALSERGRLLRTFRGTVEGRILPRPRGANGFGYDPIFFVPALGRTTAQLPPEEKNRISHRGRAFRRLKDYLAGLYGGGGAHSVS
jgi:XTP/dITP diphosphohydrolase